MASGNGRCSNKWWKYNRVVVALSVAFIFMNQIWKIIRYFRSTINTYSPLTWIVGPTMNLINRTHHLCEKREYTFIVFWEYTIISHQTLAISDDLILIVQSLNDPPINMPSHLKYSYFLDTCCTGRSQYSIIMFHNLYTIIKEAFNNICEHIVDYF